MVYEKSITKIFSTLYILGSTGDPLSQSSPVWVVTYRKAQRPPLSICQIFPPSENPSIRYLSPKFVDFVDSMTDKKTNSELYSLRITMQRLTRCKLDARCLAISCAGTLYIHFWAFCPNRILPSAKLTLRPSFAFSYIGNITAQHSSSGHQQNFAALNEEWNYGTFAEGAIYIWLGGHHVGHQPRF